MALGSLRKDSAPASLYDADFHRWTQEQARALRELRASDVDWENVAEEIESLGRSDRREIESRLTVILTHLLKWQYQKDERSGSWTSTLAEQRGRIAGLIEESPSLRSHPAKVAEKEYRLARVKAAAETGLPVEAFPERLPWSVAEMLDPDFLPGAGR